MKLMFLLQWNDCWSNFDYGRKKLDVDDVRPEFVVVGVCLAISNFLMFAGSRGDLVPGELIVLLKQVWRAEGHAEAVCVR